MRTGIQITIVVGMLLVSSRWLAAGRRKTLDASNVVWDDPRENAAGSMPLGNGEVGINVWVESPGELVFYISRTDAWSECNRLLKLGRVPCDSTQLLPRTKCHFDKSWCSATGKS